MRLRSGARRRPAWTWWAEAHPTGTVKLAKVFWFFFSKKNCFLFLLSGAAYAQTPVERVRVEAPRKSVTGVTGTAAGGGLIGEELVPKAQSTVSVDFIAKQVPAANAFDVLRLVPGANTASSDPYGLNPNVNITLRGLNGDEVAYLLEGTPLNDIGYYAGYPSQWVDSENIKSVSLAQGTADLDTPTINAGGGLVNVLLRDPSETPGGLVSGSYGSYHMVRGFARVDTGLIGDTGVSGFVSFSQTQADNDRGPGHNKRQHIDYKFVKDFGDGSHVSVVGSYHDAILSSYPLVTLADWNAYGRNSPNTYDAVFYPGNYNYWKLYQQPWRDVQVSAPAHIVAGDGLSFDMTPYFEHGFGNTPYGDVLPETGLAQGTQSLPPLNLPNAQGGQALVMGDYIGNQYRAGAVSKVTAVVGANTLVAGWWYDYADDYDPEPFTPVSLTGEPASVWGFPFTIKIPGGANYSTQEAHTLEQANVLFVGDTLNLLEGRLQIEAGLKYAMVNRDGRNGLPGPQYRVGLNSSEPLPRASVRYQVSPSQQVFASVSTNFRSPVEYILYDTYDGFGDLYTKGSHQADEYSISEELGYRYQGPALDASVSLFNYNFTNRQVATTVDEGGALIGSNINAGGQTSRGVDAEIGLRPVYHWRPYVSAEYLHATIDNDFATAGTAANNASVTDYLPTRGKIAVRSPAFQGAVGLDYDNGTYFGNLAVKYVGSQYATFMDDEQIPGHAQADATLGLRLPDIGAVHRPEARLNFVNLTDAKFLSGIASVTPNAVNTVGRNGAVIAGAPPSYYIGPGFAAVVTLVAGF
jgi:outer membrane receptor protein involved in Fe transport